MIEKSSIFASMKIVLIVALTGILLSVIAPSEMENTSRDGLITTVSGLDKILDQSEIYEQKRLSALPEYVRLLEEAESPEDLFEACYGICLIYDRYQTDSALCYAKKSIQYARNLTDNEANRKRLVKAQTMLGKQFETAGMHNQALETFGKINRKSTSPEDLATVFKFYTFIYESLESQSLDPEYRIICREMAKTYRDSILCITPADSLEISSKRKDCGDYNSALEIILPLFDRLPVENPSMGPVALEIADIYSSMGMNEEARKYLVVSAVSDIVNGKKEYIALRKLGIDLYKEGDVTRAYRYLNKALEDATFCKAKIKIEELVPILKIVDEAYKQEKDRIWNIVVLSFSIVCMLSLALIILTSRERREKKAYLEMSRQLTQAKTLQEETTVKVREASNIKDTYITGLMLECIHRIESLDNYRQNLNRMALAGEMRGLQKELKSKAVVEQEWDSFYNVFDKTFLSLFPDFIVDFNRLMKDSGKITNCTRGSLTQELRTFALVRLGISSSEKIATLLRYSRSTIYNYRSKARANALNPATFEDDLMKIQSI